jgi:hypothetical protein
MDRRVHGFRDGLLPLCAGERASRERAAPPAAARRRARSPLATPQQFHARVYMLRDDP